jgi:hypothetical protein
MSLEIEGGEREKRKSGERRREKRKKGGVHVT